MSPMSTQSSDGGPGPVEAAATLRRVVGGLLDALLPPVCVACERPLADTAGVCMACWAKIGFIERPYCERTGRPLSYDLGPGALSAAAIANPPVYDRARAVCRHGDIARQMVHGLKYRDRIELADIMGRWMARAGLQLLRESDLLIPVPLHRWRLWTRRFNQSAALAQTISKVCGLPVEYTALRRIRATRRQVGLDVKARQTNVRGAFRVSGAHRTGIAGRRVVLVDDVYTTGATVSACTRALRRAGAAQVDVLTFATVVDDGTAAM